MGILKPLSHTEVKFSSSRMGGRDMGPITETCYKNISN